VSQTARLHGDKIHKPEDHADLSQRATELKHMLTAFQKLNAYR